MADDTPMGAPPPDPALKRLDFLVGTWKLTGTTVAGPMGPPAELSGTETFEWMAGGYFLVHRWDGLFAHGQDTMVDAGYEFFDYDPETGKYRSHFFNSGGPYDPRDSHYEGDFDGNALVLVGPARFVRRHEDDDTIRYDCDFRGGDGSWTPFMHAKLTRIS